MTGLLTILLDVVRWGEPWDVEADLDDDDPLLSSSAWASPWPDGAAPA